FHDLPLGALPGQEPDQDARQARRDPGRRLDRGKRLGALLPAQSGPFHGGHAEACGRRSLVGGPGPCCASGQGPLRMRSGGAAGRALSREGGLSYRPGAASPNAACRTKKVRSEARNIPPNVAVATAAPLPRATFVSRHVSITEARNTSSENRVTISVRPG